MVPLLSGLIERTLGFRLLDWADLFRAVILLFPGMFYGMAAGFLLLDDRDDGVSAYWGVTPAGRSGYLGARLGLFSAAAFLAGILAARHLRTGQAGAGPGDRGLGDRGCAGGFLRPVPGRLRRGQGGGALGPQGAWGAGPGAACGPPRAPPARGRMALPSILGRGGYAGPERPSRRGPGRGGRHERPVDRRAVCEVSPED